MQTWLTISIPPRLKGDMLQKVAFEVPMGRKSEDFMRWWETAQNDDKDDVMKLAYEKDIVIVDALREHLEKKLLAGKPPVGW